MHTTTLEEVTTKLNKFGNLETKPIGWVESPYTISQLRAAGCTPLKLLTGWGGTKRFPRPILLNVIPKSQLRRITKYIFNLRMKKGGCLWSSGTVP